MTVLTFEGTDDLEAGGYWHHDMSTTKKEEADSQNTVNGRQREKAFSPNALDQAADTPIFDAEGKKVPFKYVYWAENGQKRRVMIVFIRHFFCGNCQEYVRSLAREIPPSDLPDDLAIVIIGCGSSTLISSYIDETKCPFPIFADPSYRLHTLLGMHRTLSLGRKDPDYIQHTLVGGALKSIWQELKRFSAGDALAGGDLRQNGGEFLFEVEGGKVSGKKLKGNAGLKCVEITWAHRMMNSRDHAEVSEVRKVIQIDGDARESRRRRERRWTSDSLRRSFSNRRTSILARTGSLSQASSSRNQSREGSRKRSPDKNIGVVKEELRSGEGEQIEDDPTEATTSTA